MKLARWIVRNGVPPVWRDSILGDLEEERARRREAGRPSGELWAALAALGIALRLRGDVWSPASARSGSRWGAGLLMDVRFAIRALRATPGTTSVAIVVLALGLGATTAIFTVADVALLRPLPFHEPHRLVAIGENDRGRPSAVPGFVGSAAVQNYREWEAQQTAFAGLAAVQNVGSFTVRSGGEPEHLQALRASASLFDVLRVRPAIGSPLTEQHERLGQGRVILIGDDLWRRRFGADPAIVGQTMTFDDGAYEIVGVLPEGFRYPVQLDRPTDVVAPLARSDRDLLRDRAHVGRNYSLRVIGRLGNGVTFEQARLELEGITARLAVQYPDWFEDRALAMAPLHESVAGRTRDWMVMLVGAVAFVLLVACANMANLLLARASARAREWRVRTALGASRWRLVRAAVVESLLLSAAGLAAALVVAENGLSLLKAAAPAAIPRLTEASLDLRVLAFAGAAALVTGLVCGVAPAWRLTRRREVAALRDGGRGSTGGHAERRMRAGLIVAEVALAVMLVVGAGLFTASFIRVMNVDLGIDIRNVVAASVSPRIDFADRASLQRGREAGRLAVAQVIDRLRATPGIVAVGAVGSGSPLSGNWRTNSLTVGGRAFTDEADQVQIKEVTPEYLEVLRVAIRRGRYISHEDSAAAPPVVVLNEEAVRRFFDGADPIGATVRLDDEDRLVVGVVDNVHVRGPEVPIAPEAYLPLAQRPGFGATVVARTATDAEVFVPIVKAAVLAAVPDVPVTARTLESSLGGMTAQRRFNMILVGLFGLLALAIAGVGIYGVMSFLVGQQTREIGVRMALGALPSGVLVLVLGRAGVYVGAGVAIGLAGAWLLAGRLEAFLFDVRPQEPVVFLVSAGAIAVTGLVAAAAPARRAARVDPVTALRSE